MANLYLMQALYAPKPPQSTPSPSVSALDNGVQSATPERLRMMEVEGKDSKGCFQPY